MKYMQIFAAVMIASLGMLASSYHLGATTYYVDSAGGIDGNNGISTNTPWQTLAKVNGTTFVAGDKILFKAGGVWSGNTQLHPLGSGTSGNPIIIDMYGTGAKPLINAGTATGNGVVYLANQQYWEINNLEITSPASSDGDRRGVHIQNSTANLTCNHIYILNCNIHGIRGKIGATDADLTAKRTGGIVVESTSTTAKYNDILIQGNTIAGVTNQGIVACINGNGGSTLNNNYPGTAAWNGMKCTSVVIRGNSISGVYKNAMIIRNTDETGLVEENICYNTANGTTGNTMFTSSVRGTVFQYNEGYENNAGDHDGSMYDADLRSLNIIFQYSYSHDNSHGLFWQYPDTSGPNDGVICRYNISQNDQGDIFALSGAGSATSYIYNNTVYISATNPPPVNAPQKIYERRSGTHTLYAYNNIFYNLNTAAIYSFASITKTFDYNVFYGVHPSTEPGDAHKLTIDPKLVSPGSGGTGLSTVYGYMLQAGSPCIDSGMTVSGNGGLDYWGNPVPYNGITDRGANEYSPSGTDTTPPTPNPMTWATAPYVSGIGSIAMIATTATDPSGVQYYFANTTITGHDSGWQAGTSYTDSGLAPGTLYTYTLTAEDQSPNYNQTAASSPASATTPAQVATPTFNPPAGSYTNTQSVTISSGTSGVFINYTIDGTAPTSTTGTPYSTPVNISATTTLKAMAFKSGMADSTVTSGTYTITACTPPAITANPVNQTVCAGSIAAFNVTAAGTSLTYQWHLSTNAGVSFSNISGATSSSYSTAATAVGDSGKQYRCVITGTCGNATSTAATLTVNGRPSAVVGGSATICSGNATIIQAALIGIGPWNVTWSDGSNQNGVAASLATRSVSPNSTTTYTVTALTDANCTAQGGDLTGSALITVNAAPPITANPSSRAVCAASTAAFSVTATGAGLTYQWQLSTNAGVSFANISAATSSSYNTPATVAGDSGKQYRCAVTGTCGSATSTAATLTVNVAPVITANPSSQTVCAGSAAGFSLIATGASLTYQWQISTNAGVSFGNVSGATSSSYSTPATVAGESGKQYRCVVTGTCGTTNSTAATLTVNIAPAITTQPQSHTVPAGSNVTFTVTATGTAPLAYQWRKNGANIGGTTGSSYTLTAITTNNAGNYDVVITNSCGSAFSSVATLIVTVGTPGAIVISEVYPGGGKSGATYQNDFVVLKNKGGSSVNINGWSLQHDKGGTWQTPFALPNVSIPPGKYFLIKCYNDGGTVSGAALPTPDAATPQTSVWNISTAAGAAVALVNNTTTLTSCSGASIVDIVGINSTTSNCYEGAGVAPTGSATQSDQRASNGCQDNNNNANDFALGTPTPENSATAAALCP